ncbi:SSI family serine proteinase inhibitor [Actinacidiphila oryziradicis]|uniref:SSI family serine proteinase inhibitor n=1 Tax=Actinacidiphila oryziradicis TaxID=2571141 RepID=UPI0023F3AE9A|nr:SSI family serine proteinase inhibitor [Actinacidiphila oryziradicis]MCW2872783.1 hypothetical protein [Actinacidiphila oryziradicis]
MRFTRVPLTAAFALGLPLLGGAPAMADPGSSGDHLTVTVDDGAGRRVSYELECDPPSGTHPDPERACERLEELGGPMGPVPTGRMCTMIYGGSQTATVTGRWHWMPVHAAYSQANGCEIARWRNMAPVLSEPRWGMHDDG